MKTKTCKQCIVDKLITDFGPHSTTSDGYNTKCKSCISDYQREYRAQTTDKRSQYHHEYYRNNQEKIKDRFTQYRSNNVDRVKQTNADFYQKNKEKQLQVARNNYQKNKEVYKDRAKLYRKNNPDKIAANLAKRRASKKQAIPKWANMSDIRKLYTEAQMLTESSGIEYQVDHIVPLNSNSVCGLHCEDNLRVITAKENNSKNNKLLEELF